MRIAATGDCGWLETMQNSFAKENDKKNFAIVIHELNIP